MKLVIDIPDEIYYKETLSETDIPRVIGAIRKGVNLPKSHGRLMVLSEDKIKDNLVNLSFSNERWINEVSLSDATVAILEADKEE